MLCLTSRCLRRSRLATFVTSKRLFYDCFAKNDTIFAPMTELNPVKGSALSVIRISGSNTAKVLSKLTHYSTEQSPHESIKYIKPRQATLAKISSPTSKQLIDIGLVLWFPKPNSYTGEDVCELHLHGSQAIVSSVMSSLGLIPGVRPAEPGEFTMRALKNGKMSLIQAESLPDLIKSKTDAQRKSALSGLEGKTRARYDKWIYELIRILGHQEASIDFGEDEMDDVDKVVTECNDSIRQLTKDIDDYIQMARRSKELIDLGPRVAIIGKPNAGKSSLMNCLCKTEKSIVSDLSGTTRDIVEQRLDIDGNVVSIQDTAGLKSFHIRTTTSQNYPDMASRIVDKHDSIEQEGIKRALNAARQSDIILYVIDGTNLIESNQNMLENELDILSNGLRECDKPKAILLVVNKCDLMESSAPEDILVKQLTRMKSSKLISSNIALRNVSCMTGKNIDLIVEWLSGSIRSLITERSYRSPNKLPDTTDGKEDFDYINERHLSLLSAAHRHLSMASTMRTTEVAESAQHVREAVAYLSKIVGDVTNDEVLDVIFRDFCIGK